MAIPKVVFDVKPKKIVFDDDGEVVNDTKQILEHEQKSLKENSETRTGEKKFLDDTLDNEKEDYFEMREKKKSIRTSDHDSNATKKWYIVFSKYPSTEEILDMKDNDQMELFNICRLSYEQEKPTFLKQNPSDARWLYTALHKGTAKDRANAGALLVTSNPLANLEALSTLIGFTKLTNKSCTEVMSVVSDLWKEVLLPPHRKLYSLQMRGADWKLVRKDTSITKEQQRKIYAYWHFENELKDYYFEFLKNVQQGIQTGQENNKTVCIVTASQLLSFAPEKEQMLLTMLINKLGDPTAKIASKALHHLTEVAHRHPNMCGVIVNETEKLLFRNNISDRAQHFALCYLASIAPSGRTDVCTKLVNICFSLFKALVQKGAINNRTMQAILRCLQKAILEAKPQSGSSELLSKEMQDTIYRLVHLADIRVSIQTLGLLLQLVTVKTEKSDRFYNALYTKLIDLNLTTISSKSAAQLLHIVHRAIYIDSNVSRAQAFIKRLLQLSLYMPSNMAAGCLIVIHKLIRSRKDLISDEVSTVTKVNAADIELSKFDSDGEEKYLDVHENSNQCKEYEEESQPTTNVKPSWHHSNLIASESTGNVRDLAPNKYNPYHRVPTFAGSEFVLRNELVLLQKHFHPTVQVFADNIINNKRINYYGDPLRDFGLPHFLERFSFKNPKKLNNEKKNTSLVAHKQYISYGTRGLPVKSLTRNNCTEEEMFIFNYLEQKRKQSPVIDKSDEDENEVLKAGDVSDDEFEDYLDGFFGKKLSKNSNKEDNVDDEEIDFLKEFGDALGTDLKRNNSKKTAFSDDEGNVNDINDDWGDGEKEDPAASDMSEDEEVSVELNDDEDDDVSISMDDASSEDNSNSDIDSFEPHPKKTKRNAFSEIDERSFAKKLKHSDDLNTLFAAADDFAELLEETGKTKGQGTANAVFNTDKSSKKQLKWEEQRLSNVKRHKHKANSGKVFSKRR